MTNRVEEILKPLSNYWDKLVRRPLAHSEVASIEKLVGIQMPYILKEYLQTIGLFQDFINQDEIEVFSEPKDFAFNRESIIDILGPDANHLFPFGHNGAGDVYALSTFDSKDTVIRFIDHERRQVEKHKSFLYWLESRVKFTLESIDERVPNTEKVWGVQFYFSGATFEDIVNLISLVENITITDSEWQNHSTSSAGVTSCERSALLSRVSVRFSKLDYKGWEEPSISFGFFEPVDISETDSLIKKLHTCFIDSPSSYKYKFGDYGPISREAIK